MLHAFHIENGRVGYKNRWARTKKFELERAAGRALFSAFNPMDADPSVVGMETDGLANTNIVWHGGRLLRSRKDTRHSSSIRIRWRRKVLGISVAG